jgi:hypothetical protein
MVAKKRVIKPLSSWTQEQKKKGPSSILTNGKDWRTCIQSINQTYKSFMKIEQLVIASLNYNSLGHGIQGVRKRCEIWDFFTCKIPIQKSLFSKNTAWTWRIASTNQNMCNLKVGLAIGTMHCTQPREGDLKGVTRILVFQTLTPHIVDSWVLIEAQA